MNELTAQLRLIMQRRVKSRVIIEDRGYLTPCWISTRALQRGGYTKIGLNGKTLLTHRVSYMAFVGPIGIGLQIDHLCRVRACCNPEHLEPVTCSVNLLRGETLQAEQVRRTHCPRGHEYTVANTYRRRDSAKRECWTCRNDYRVRRQADGRGDCSARPPSPLLLRAAEVYAEVDGLPHEPLVEVARRMHVILVEGEPDLKVGAVVHRIRAIRRKQLAA